ncbi:Endocytosis regulator [Pleosporales sp. CAS-2024a]
MPGRLLSTLARVAPSPLPKAEKPAKPPVYSLEAPAVQASSKSQESLVMDIFKRHDKHHADKKSPKPSPKVEPQPQVTLDMSVESPPIVFYNGVHASTGAIFSGQLMMHVHEPYVTVQNFEMRLLAIVSTRKPVAPHCADCTAQSTPIHTWEFLTHPASLRHGAHSYPFSHLLPGHLPATTHGSLATLDYYLSAVATLANGTKMTYRRSIDIKRAIFPGPEKHSIRIFPPTNLTASVKLPPVIHPIGDFPIEMRLSGIVQNKADSQTRWRLRKLTWRIEETQKFIAPACTKHMQKLGGEAKGLLHEDVRTIANDEVKTGWKTDFDRGEIDAEFNAACNLALNPLCDMDSQNGMSVKHNLIIELVVAEEWAPLKKLTQATPTGAARVLRTHFHLVLTERSGMGIAWDEEQPPVYEDVPASPPTYMDECEDPISTATSRSASFSI